MVNTANDDVVLGLYRFNKLRTVSFITIRSREQISTFKKNATIAFVGGWVRVLINILNVDLNLLNENPKINI